MTEGCSPVSAARNLALYDAQQRDAKYVLFWDDDLIPRKTNAVAELISVMDNIPEATLVGSVCAIRRTPVEPVVTKEEGDGAWYGWRDGKNHKVFHSGTGFLLIRMDDINDLSVPEVEVDGEQVRRYFDEYDYELEEYCTDDVHFAKLMRAHDKLWLVNGSVICDQIDKDKKMYRVPDRVEIVA